jgi:N-acetylneuraminic acid mutarotase
VAGRVLVVGGEASSQIFNRVEAYDPKGDSWGDYAAMPTARHGLAVAELGGKLYVIAGGTSPSKPASSINEIFQP